MRTPGHGQRRVTRSDIFNGRQSQLVTVGARSGFAGPPLRLATSSLADLRADRHSLRWARSLSTRPPSLLVGHLAGRVLGDPLRPQRPATGCVRRGCRPATSPNIRGWPEAHLFVSLLAPVCYIEIWICLVIRFEFLICLSIVAIAIALE